MSGALCEPRHVARKRRDRSAVAERGVEEPGVQICTLERCIEPIRKELEDSKTRNKKCENGIYGQPQVSAIGL